MNETTCETTPYQPNASTAIVTGSSSGIGREIAERLARNGVDVVVCSRDIDNVEPVAAEIDGRDGGAALAVECDVRDRESIESLLAATEAELGAVDLLVNNAGATFQAPFEDLSPNGWQTVLDINLTGIFNCTQLVGERMRAGDGGCIINISSVAARDGSPHMAHYASAKSGVDSLTRTLGYEWARYGIRINGIAPGLVLTDEMADRMELEDGIPDRDAVDRQIGRPEDVALVAQFLASDAARYIQGETIAVEGVPRIARTRHHEDPIER